MLKILSASLVFFLFSPTAFAQQGGTSSCKTTYEGGVSCGGLSSQCKTTYEGTVACGGLSTKCVETSTGNVACGGLAKECIVSSTGNVACGGDVKSRQMYPPSMKSIPFRIPIN